MMTTTRTIDLEELERNAKPKADLDLWWDRVYDAPSPKQTIALIARIRELERGYGDLLGEVEERSDNPNWYSEHTELLEKGVVLP